MDNPTYEQVCSGRTGHTEAVEMTYRPEEVRSIEMPRTTTEPYCRPRWPCRPCVHALR